MSEASPGSSDAEKDAAARAAIAEIAPGMVVGLGTGSTVAFAITALAERVADGLRIEAVATSRRTEAAAREAGITVIDFAGLAAVDLAIDGVDEVDPELRAIKGGGGAMLREKIVADAAARMIAIADATKRVARLGARPVPVETLPFARERVRRRIADLGGDAALRLDAAGAPEATDQGNEVLDCRFGAIADPAALAIRLAAIPGVLGHGLFLDEIDALYVGSGGGVLRIARTIPPPGILMPASSLLRDT